MAELIQTEEKAEHYHWIESFPERPNPEAELIEKTLGIRFPDGPPNKRIITYFGALRLILSAGDFKDKVGYAVATAKLMTGEAGYIAPAKTILINPRNRHPQLSSLHENSHAWVDQMNPQLTEDHYTLGFTDLLKQALKDQQPEESEKEIERLIVSSIIDEGIADWFTITTGLKSEIIIDKAPYITRYNRAMTGRTDLDNRLVEMDGQFLADSIGLIKKGMATYQRAVQEEGLAEQLNRAYAQIQPRFGIIGFQYANTVLKGKQSTKDALEDLVNNPPQTIQEISAALKVTENMQTD